MAHDLDRLNIALRNRYEVSGQLGAGGMAIVYVAKDTKHDRAVALKVLDSGDAAHRRGVVRRDLKPENVLIHQGVAMLTDFGIALASSVGTRLTETGLLLGTPAYMSPEQAAGGTEIDPRSDVYSLACLLFEMLTGGPPFSARTAQAILVLTAHGGGAPSCCHS